MSRAFKLFFPFIVLCAAISCTRGLETGPAVILSQNQVCLNGCIGHKPLIGTVGFVVSTDSLPAYTQWIPGQIKWDENRKSFTRTLKHLTPGTSYYYRSYYSIGGKVRYADVKSFATSDYSFTAKGVDLGLPSGTIWSNVNLGASKEYEFGAFFYWGETIPRPDYSLDWDVDDKTAMHQQRPYLFAKGYNQFTKYVTNSAFGYEGFVDNLSVLEPQDDAATVLLGEGWETPKNYQWEELISAKNCEWSIQVVNDVKGYLVTSKSNGNRIFIPKAGAYMSSVLTPADPSFAYAYDFSEYDEEKDGFEEESGNEVDWTNLCSRIAAIPVRPVVKNSGHTVSIE